MINIAEILKDCPKRTKLYSPIFGEGWLSEVGDYLIKVYDNNANDYNFYHDGSYVKTGECMLFPSKDNRDWNTFHRPFQDGDILVSENGNPYIFKEGIFNISKVYCAISPFNKLILGSEHWTPINASRFATEEEKQKLFDAIKENGYKWDEETKTLEKLVVPKFKVGDKIVKKDDDPTKSWYVQGIDTYCNSDYYYIITKGQVSNLHFKDQDEWEIIPNKFDISTLKAYDKVLVRDTNEQVWVADLFSNVLDRPLGGYTFACVGHYPNQCIPYEGNEHLLGTNNDCDEYYKNW